MKYLSLKAEVRKNAQLNKTDALYLFAKGNRIIKLGIFTSEINQL